MNEKLKKKAILWVLPIIYIIGMIIAVQIDDFGGSQTVYFDFNASSYLFTNITVSKYANFTNAVINFTGLQSDRQYLAPDISNCTNTTGTFSVGNCAASNDSNFSSYFSMDLGNTTVLYQNYTVLSKTYANYRYKTDGTLTLTGFDLDEGGSCGCNHILTYCKNWTGDWVSFACCSYSSETLLVDVPTDCHQNDTLQIKTEIIGNYYTTTYPDLTTKFYEAELDWFFISYPNQTNISLNNTSIFSTTADFNTSNLTANFSSTLNSALESRNCDCSGCQLIGSNCSINISMFSERIGMIKASQINITWVEFFNPNLTINSPNETFTGITNIPLNITANDNHALDYCYFNVTRGASLEKANTKISNCSYMTFTVSGDATYVIHICINDTSNNQNCSSATFVTTDYVPPAAPGGGGGGWRPTEEDEEKEKEVFCDPLLPSLEEAWDNFMEKLDFETFTKLWFAFWNYGTCKQTASFLPI